MRNRRRILIVGVALVASLIGTLLIVGFVFDGYRIVSSAMEPTLLPGDRVLARDVTGDEVGRGDRIVFVGPDTGVGLVEERIMRVVAVAGDEISTKDGKLVINGEPVEESYLATGMTTTRLDPLEVPSGHVYVLGDNRMNAEDSRIFGPVPHSSIKARVVFIWWPLSRIGGS